MGPETVVYFSLFYLTLVCTFAFPRKTSLNQQIILG